MRSRLIDRKKYLKLDLEDRLKEFKSDFKMSEEDFQWVLGESDPHEKIKQAAKVIYKQARILGYSKSQSLSHITSGTLGIFLGSSKNLINDEFVVARDIAELFSADHEYFQDHKGVKMTIPESLRIITFEDVEKKDMVLNAENANISFKNHVDFSYIDLIRGIKVPTAIGLNEAIYIGMLYFGSKIESKNNSVCFYGSSKEYHLVNIINKYFNRNMFNIGNNGNGNGLKNGKPKSIINSKAVHSWIKYCFKLEDTINDRIFPRKKEEIEIFNSNKIYLTEPQKILEQGFLYGAVARKARFNKLVKGYNFVMNLSKNIPLLSDLKELSENLGYKPSLDPKQGRLVFGQQDYERIISSPLLETKSFPYDVFGGLFNPEHLSIVRSNQ